MATSNPIACKLVFNRDRKEDTWHYHWRCQLVNCPSPQCVALRKQSYTSAEEARLVQACNAHSEAVAVADKTLARVLASIRTPAHTISPRTKE